jgi:nicotinamidase-related amidase
MRHSKRHGSLVGPRTAVLFVDVVNPFDFPGADALLANALRMTAPIARLRREARRAGAHVVYVNDNFGDWHHGLRELVASCRSPRNPGRDFVAAVAPGPGDYYVLKPRHSGFLSTSLDALLAHLGVDTVVICGMATHICVLFTAIDAYMRDLRVVIPADCVASESQVETERALSLMADVVKATVRPADSLRFARSRAGAERRERVSPRSASASFSAGKRRRRRP